MHRRRKKVPTFIAKPTRVEAAGNKPKLIDEYVGRVNSATSATSVAHMRSPGGWQVHDSPPAIALLDVPDGERRHLGAPKPASQERSQDRAVAQPLGSR